MMTVTQKKVFLPTGLFLFFLAVFYLLGFQNMKIPWDYYQILDKELLLEYPGYSLLFLHSQPPVLNSLIVLLLKISRFFPGIYPE